MRPIPFQLLSSSMLTAGAIIALWGVLTVAPAEVIDSSINWNDEPGMITALFDSSKISDYIHHRNKAVFSLVLVILGFMVGSPWFSKTNMPPKALFILILFFLLLAIVVAGTTRQKVLNNWQDSRYHWFLSLLDDNEFIRRNAEWKARRQEKDNLKDMKIFLGHIKESLNITSGSSLSNVSEPTFEQINQYRLVLKADINNRSLFYYLFRPKQLFWAFK